ncbi:TRAP transporter small permease [Paracandidimonas soli]|uniref:TRAP transporter small permease n=1 Tax=Paracandidimonas soli TaxID=1917182 RepID=UPI00333F56FE
MNRFSFVYDRLVVRLEDCVLNICSLLVVVMSVSLLLEVGSRNLFSYSFVWAMELATACFIWVAFLGATVGVRRNEHFVVDLLYRWFPEGHPVSIFLQVLSYLLIALLGMVFLVHGLDFVGSGMRRYSFSLGIKQGYLMLIMPISGALFIINAVYGLLRVAAEKGSHHHE